MQYIDELSLSVHWYDESTAQDQTGSPKHFALFSDRISKNIKSHQGKNFFFANIVLNRKNYKDALQIVRFVRQSHYPVQQILISVVAPEGLADDRFSELVFDLEDFRWQIPELVSYCEDNGLVLRFFGLPSCILGAEYLEYANDLHWEERHTIERFVNAD